MTEPKTATPVHDDLSFKKELYHDLLNPSLKAIHERLENALRAQQGGKPQPNNRVPKRAKQAGTTFHCEVCEENPIFKAPTNLEVKFNQFSRLTLRDMSDALFQKEETIYSTHSGLMAVVNTEQTLFDNFLKSLGPKFKQAKSHLSPQWFDHAKDSYRRAACKLYGSSPINYRLSTTHSLNLTVSSATLPTIERFGQILAYGAIQKLKLPKLGHQIKCKIEMLKFDSNVKILAAIPKNDLTAAVLHDVPSKKHCPEVPITQIAMEAAAWSAAKAEACIEAELSQESDDMEIDEDAEKTEKYVASCGVPSEAVSTDVAEPDSFDVAKGSSESVTQPTDGTLESNEQPVESGSIENPSDKSKAVFDIKYKHVKVAISQDLDVFINNVPINQLGGNHRADITHKEVVDFLVGLKVAECISDIESLCHIFSSFPPDFSKSFLFKICVCVQDDKSKYFKISAPLPSSRETPESIKQDILTQFILKAASKKMFDSECDANISFLEYLNDCGAQLIDRQDSSQDLQTQLKDHIEPMKFTSYLPWVNLNSETLDSKLYSLFAIADTNVIIHSQQPFVVDFEEGLEKAVVYIKPQYSYIYGLEVMSNTENSYLYLKSLLLDCVGVVVIHVDMSTLKVVQIEKIPLETMSTRFSKALAIGRLASFFETLHTLKEGSFVYNHDITQPHSVVYEEFSSEHIQTDFRLSSEESLQLSPHTSPVDFSKTQLTAWQRHNVRLPLCYHPRRAGTYLCHEYLSKENCSNSKVCAFAHLTKTQLERELGKREYDRFIGNFEKPKDDKDKPAQGNKNKSFGKILDKKQNRGRKRKR